MWESEQWPVPIPHNPPTPCFFFPRSPLSNSFFFFFTPAFTFIRQTLLLPLSLSPLIKLLNIDSACWGHGGPRGRRVGDLRWFWAPGSQRRRTRRGSAVSTLLLDRPTFSNCWWIPFLLASPTCSFDHRVYFYSLLLSPRSETKRAREEAGIFCGMEIMEEKCISGSSRMFDISPLN